MWLWWHLSLLTNPLLQGEQAAQGLHGWVILRILSLAPGRSLLLSWKKRVVRVLIKAIPCGIVGFGEITGY